MLFINEQCMFEVTDHDHDSDSAIDYLIWAKIRDLALWMLVE